MARRTARWFWYGPRTCAPSRPADLRRSLDPLMLAPHADQGLDALLVSGVLESLLPEVKGMVGFGDGEWRHKDVWKHTKQVVTQALPRLEVRWAALFHDIGKVRTRSVGPKGEVHFFGHAEVGARMFDKLERRERPLLGRRIPARSGPISRLAPPSSEPIRRQLDRQRCSPIRARNRPAPRRPPVPLARRHHDQASGKEAPRDPDDRRARRSHHRACGRGRQGRAAAEGASATTS